MTAPEAGIGRDGLPPAGSEGDVTMSLGAHLEELRSRIILCLVLFGTLFLGSICSGRYVFALARYPLEQAMVGLSLSAAEKARLVQWDFLGPVDGFSALARFSLRLALALSLPMLLYQGWCFVRPGLRDRERSALLPVVRFGTVLFLLGAVVAYFHACPVAFQALYLFNHWLGGENVWTAANAIALVQTLCIGFGLAFELPLVMLMLGKAGLVRSAQLVGHRRHALLAIFVLGAIFTPPDPATQVMMAGVLYLLFEAGLLLVRSVEGAADPAAGD